MSNLLDDKNLLNDEGFLVDSTKWNVPLAKALAEREGITLNNEHLAILSALRSFYDTYEHTPAMRPLVKICQEALPHTQVNTLFLHQLFPDNPAKLAAKIAGLPKPKHCL